MTASVIAGDALIAGLALLIAVGLVCVAVETVRWLSRWSARGVDRATREALGDEAVQMLRARQATPERHGAWGQ